MDPQYIAQERINSVKELSEIQMNLATAKAEYEDVKEKLESFKKIREEEAKKKIDAYIKSSQDALEEINNNYRLIKDFRYQTETTLKDVKEAHDFVINLMDSLNKMMDDLEVYFVEKSKKMDEEIVKIKEEYKKIDEEKKRLEEVSAKQKIVEKKLIDRRATLERAWLELEKKEL